MKQYLLINIVSTKDSWHFQTILESQTEILHSFANSNRTKRFSCTNLKRVKVIIAVYEIAIRRGDLSSALPSSVRSVGRIINKEKEIYVYLNYLRKRELGETRELYEELLQLAFIINYFTQELRTKNEKIKLGKELVKNSENPIIKPCVGLINRICKKYKLSESSYYLLAYYICNCLIVIHYLKLYKFMKLDKFYTRKGETEKFIQMAIKKNFTIYQNNPSFDKLVFNFTQIIMSHIKLVKNTPSYVYVEFQHRPEYKSIIENALIHI